MQKKNASLNSKELAEMQEKMELKSTRVERDKPAYVEHPMISERAVRNPNLLTKDNLKRFDVDSEGMPLEEQDFSELLMRLNLPDNLFEQMENLPEELQGYILEEIIHDINMQKITHV